MASKKNVEQRCVTPAEDTTEEIGVAGVGADHVTEGIDWDELDKLTDSNSFDDPGEDEDGGGSTFIEMPHPDVAPPPLPISLPKPLAFAESNGSDDASSLAAEPTKEEIAAAEALLMRIGRGPNYRAQLVDVSVSDKPDPIKLLEPEALAFHVVNAGDMNIIASPEHIQVVRRALDPMPEQPAREPVVMTERIRDRITAEQNAGRTALNRHVERASLFPRPKPTEREIAQEGKSIPVLRADYHPLANLLNKPVVQGKGGGM